MAYKIRSKTLDLVIRAYLRGEEVSRDTIAMLTGINTKQVNGVYLKEFLAWKERRDSEEEVIEETVSEQIMSEEVSIQVEPVVEKKSFSPNKVKSVDLTGYKVKIEDDNGVEGADDYEVLEFSNTARMIVIKQIKPELKDIIVNGVKISVDLRKLKAMSPDAVVSGVKVSTLLIAATIA